ncbi:hypothetical protein CO051_06105 [Candidatus Roizmanbacteria bacterium CG_4_9_14_0_2_um_filter_39_13]|uniref:NTP pyrophosphohydrolase MazG-like domain-containing protein n=2 Tax=Candidatus Roizmaniibacteriota TaxID=1752723 RepID=A0A2M8EWZ1_9BACT|nr:MAG: hypothetical protein COY15_04570 [Candidatus Roizmanbacteria bacterium CG_4_10_14_0_2_um_filter_39_12]PJC30396.1 MAG: hypothetical protein CO051_06105 [Candidatus Roizmanbacteria bacterium CG_4_9_14_0_2_um_filter_39_13]PJE61323.1 MAG: hypothetical protein COU87_05165 [Candidatus Roizmanbacteria bacterium CG10_big_fil_rev_8_21_14_0_10_39_12]
MDIKTLQLRAEKSILRSNLDFKLNTTREKAILAHTVKLNEEMGELCNDILSILKLQRASKLENFEKSNMYAEFADVLITVLQLASIAQVDMERAIRDKMKKIETRKKKEKKED